MAPRQLNSLRVPHYGQESSGTASGLTTADATENIRKQRPALFTFYNSWRPHSALGGQTPDMVYFGVPLRRKPV